MQVSVSDATENAISRLIADGAYSSPGDVVDAAIAILDLKRELEIGLSDLQAGRVAPLDMESIKEQVRARTSSSQAG